MVIWFFAFLFWGVKCSCLTRSFLIAWAMPVFLRMFLGFSEKSSSMSDSWERLKSGFD